MAEHVAIVGAGLAGTEAAHQLAKRGFSVSLYEMRPTQPTPVHKTDHLAEMVCSNSLRSDDPYHPVGLLKREMMAWDSLVIRIAREHAVPAGAALAVDRLGFSGAMTEAIAANPNIRLIREEVAELPVGPAIIAAGPLCSQGLSRSLYAFLGDRALYFYDAIAPVVDRDSIDESVVFFQSRYGKGEGDDYLNIPLDEAAYRSLVQELANAERTVAKPHEEMIFFEGCLPVEVMAERGVDTLRFGPMKPVGLTDPRTGEQPYAVLQLRQDNFAKSLWNMVGFQTQLKWGEQKRIFGALPGLTNARFVRYGMIHRNTFVDSPKHLLPTLQFRKRRDLFLAGQITGVEGYVESAAAGLMAAVNMARFLEGRDLVPFPPTTAMGSLAHYVAFPGHTNFQPTNVNFGIIAPFQAKRRIRRSERRKLMVERAVRDMKTFSSELGEPLLAVGDWGSGAKVST